MYIEPSWIHTSIPLISLTTARLSVRPEYGGVRRVISSCIGARIEIPDVFRGFSRSPDSTEVVATMSRDC